ncbi:MAG TPA: phosphatase PAP2 family protein [Holophaga sp.]|nr:phosphatase PAP2 family protein [Holophaga sp.]
MAGSRYPFGLEGPLGPWRAMDRWVVGYALATLPILGWGAFRGAPGCLREAGVSLATAGACVLYARLTARTANPVAILLRLFFAPIVYWNFYHQVQTIWPLLHGAPFDGILAAADQRIFGCQPSLAFRAALPWRGLSEILCLAYLAYYFFSPIVGLSALLTRGYASAERILTAATATFLLCYAFFWLVPTVAPHFWFPPHLGPRPYDGWIANHALFFFTGGGEIRGGAFPSSHIAVALLFTLWARRETPFLFPFLAVATALMLPAVVYLHAHWTLDIPAGLLVGFLAYKASRRWLA